MELKTTTKKLKWASNKIDSMVSQPTFGGEGFFKQLYQSLKQTQCLLIELWDKSFDQEVIKENLGLKVVDWDRGMMDLISFLNIHKTQNQNLRHLFEEFNLPSKLKKFTLRNKIEQCLENPTNISEGSSVRYKTIAVKNKNSFFAFGFQNTE